MAVPVRCPNPRCGATSAVAEDLVGRAIRCTHCGQRFTLPASRPEAPGGAGATVPEPRAKDTVDDAAAAGTAVPAGPDAGSGQIGRFRIRDRVGAGAFGTVYRAYDGQLDREVALKVPRPGALDSPQAVERFLREGRAAARLRHPHIVPVYEAGLDGEHPYLATAFIDGWTLDRAAGAGRLGHRRAAEIVRDLAQALDYAHEQGVVHRDVKPANVLLDRDHGAQLTDFGLAYHQDAAGKLTQEGAILGTPAYMAPEQAGGQVGPARPASDQYSLGVILYELLCGRTPFSGPPHVLLYNVIHQQPPFPRSIDPDVPPELEAICLRAMARRPEDRYARCQGLADDLGRWLAAQPGEARPPSPPARAVRRHEWRPAVIIAGTVALAVALVAGALVAVILTR
jgi:serine/threonine protein kinase